MSSLHPIFRMKMLPIRLFDRLLEGTTLYSLNLGGNNELYPTPVYIFIWRVFTYTRTIRRAVRNLSGQQSKIEDN
jgi:hypothetical protein